MVASQRVVVSDGGGGGGGGPASGDHDHHGYTRGVHGARGGRRTSSTAVLILSTSYSSIRDRIHENIHGANDRARAPRPNPIPILSRLPSAAR